MGLNFVGKTWTTNYMFGAVLKTVQLECPWAIPTLVKAFAEDVEMLLRTGIVSKDGLTQIWMAHIGHKGDLPALVDMGGFRRSYRNVARGAVSRKACAGVCHLCLAGRELDVARGHAAHPFEDVNPSASWVGTIGVEPPWEGELPNILRGVPVTGPEQVRFFVTDLWHNLHMGLAKHFLACSFVCIIESNLEGMPPGSVENKFTWLTSIYRSYFQSKNTSPFVNEISRDTLNFPASTASPIGKWSKGAASTEMMMFLDFFGRNYIENKSDDELLCAIVSQSELDSVGS